ncbi:DUF2254 domain-containing protein [Cellulomonas endophytica]|uniref:DUF2254 domain-containing protein n=1 Tax=Cellulomonas endophytica TaxID=2494735 RepID=UPI001012F5A1|nr:DUF2254 domain-containing protein [Cellulomonas endophytica]
MSRLVHLRQRFWFLPAVMCVVAVVVAEVLVTLERRTGGLPLPGWLSELVLRVGAAGSRDVLGAVATSSLAVAGTTFSITVAVLALTSSAYGPRLVPAFLADRGNQLVLGVLVATFLYSLLVLRSIRSVGDVPVGDPGDEDVFVPHLAVNLAVLLAVADVAVLVWFIHHISDSIQVWTLSGGVREDLLRVVGRQYPAGAGAPDEGRVAPTAGPLAPSPPAPPARATGRAVATRRSGYVELVETGRLLRLARRHDVVVAVLVRPGDHVIPGEDVLVVTPASGAGTPEGRVVTALRSAVVVSDARSPRQDVAFVVQQLTDLAVRALSPGTNDPTTAVNALDDLSAGLALLVSRPAPVPVHRDRGGQVRLHLPPQDRGEVVRGVLEAVRWHGAAAPTVVRAALRLVRRLVDAGAAPDVRAVLDAELGRLRTAVAMSALVPEDVVVLTSELDGTRAHVRGPAADGPGPGPGSA